MTPRVDEQQLEIFRLRNALAAAERALSEAHGVLMRALSWHGREGHTSMCGLLAGKACDCWMGAARAALRAPVPPGETRRQEVIATANRILDEVCGPRLPAPAAHPETTPKGIDHE